MHRRALSPADIGIPTAKGSRFLSRPILMIYAARRKTLLAHANHRFDVVDIKAVTVAIGQT